jgi:hypothetical protein
MNDIKIERLTVKESLEVHGGKPVDPSHNGAGGTSDCTNPRDCCCVCG